MFGEIAGAALGLVNQGIQNQNQIAQQNNLLQQQYIYDTMASARNYNYQMALFNSTGYGAQMEQMKNAGLNPALMYAKGGNPGQTNAQPGSVNANTSQKTHTPLKISILQFQKPNSIL